MQCSLIKLYCLSSFWIEPQTPLFWPLQWITLTESTGRIPHDNDADCTNYKSELFYLLFKPYQATLTHSHHLQFLEGAVI